MMNEPIPFFGWLQDVEDTEQMLRKQIQIVQAELDRLQQENTALRKQADYIAQLEKGLESNIAMNKALVERDK